MSSPGIQGLQWLEQITKWLMTIARQNGYPGIFLISLIGSLSIIVPIPYTMLIFAAGHFLDPFLVAIVAGAGSALGEFSGYALGYYGRAIISKEQQKKMNYVLRIFNRYGAITIFIFALTPLPDDLLFIPLGIMRYSFLKAFLPCLLGKILMSGVLSYSGHLSIRFIRQFLGEESEIWTIIVSTILLIIIMVAMFKVDWEKTFPIEEKGKDKPKS